MYLWNFDIFDPSTYHPSISTYHPPIIQQLRYVISLDWCKGEKNATPVYVYRSIWGVPAWLPLKRRIWTIQLISSNHIPWYPHIVSKTIISHICTVFCPLYLVSINIYHIYIYMDVGCKVDIPISRATSRYVPRQTWHGALVVRKDETSRRPELSAEKPCWLMKLKGIIVSLYGVIRCEYINIYIHTYIYI